MKEGARLPIYLARFFDSRELARKALEAYLEENPGATKSQTFNALASGRGIPDTHCSGKRQGVIKEGRKKY